MRVNQQDPASSSSSLCASTTAWTTVPSQSVQNYSLTSNTGAKKTKLYSCVQKTCLIIYLFLTRPFKHYKNSFNRSALVCGQSVSAPPPQQAGEKCLNEADSLNRVFIAAAAPHSSMWGSDKEKKKKKISSVCSGCVTLHAGVLSESVRYLCLAASLSSRSLSPGLESAGV